MLELRDKLIVYFIVNPDEELTSKDIVAKFGSHVVNTRVRLMRLKQEKLLSARIDSGRGGAYVYSIGPVLKQLAGGMLTPWQPIDTAPKDGTHVLVNDTTDSFSPWAKACYLNVGEGEWQGWAYVDASACEANPEGPKPTHWIDVPVNT